MQLIPLSEAESGMRLARPVYDRRKRLLLGSGAVLSENHLSTLRRLDVRELFIHQPAALFQVEPAAERAMV